MFLTVNTELLTMLMMSLARDADALGCVEVLLVIRTFLIAFFSLYTARPSFEYYRQAHFVHSGMQDESLQVTISKLP